MRLRTLTTLLLTLLLAGCDCGQPAQRQYADLRWLPSDRLVVDGDEAVLDLGSIPFGTTQTATATLQNAGAASSTATITASESGPFTWAASEHSVPSGERLDLQLELALPEEDVDARDISATMRVALTGGVKPGESTERTLTVRARGYRFQCELPDELDFGLVRVGERATRSISFANTSDGFVSPVVLPNENAAFEWSATTEPIGPRRARDLDVTFAPTNAGEHLGMLHAIGGPGCPQQAIRLKGRAVGRWLEWQPSIIECGWVLRDEVRSRSLTFTNHARDAIALSEAVVVGNARVVNWPDRVEAGQSVVTTVECQPTELGAQSATIQFEDDVDGAAAIPVTMSGGGPRIAATPQPVAFGATAIGTRTTRSFIISNTGNAVPDAGVDANLLLENDAGVPIVRATEHVTVSTTGFYRGERGLIEGESLPFEVSLVPTEPGPWQQDITFQSNDPRAPTYSVRLTGEAIAVPPCQLQSSRQTLEFGLLYRHETRSRAVTFQNTGNSPCLLSALDIDAMGKAAGFSLRGGRIEAMQLPATATHTAVVDVESFPNNTPGAQQGALQFEVSNPSAPTVRVELRASSAPVCASTEPEPVDFGDVPIGCRLSRLVTTTNVCVTPFAPWPYTTSAPFSVDAGIPPVLVSPDSHVATVTFLPTDAGVSEGELTIGVPGGFRQLALHGRGVVGPTVTESFTQRADAELDVLYVTRLNGAFEPLDGGYPTEWVTEALGEGLLQLVDAGVSVRAAVVVGDWDHTVGTSNNLPWSMGELLRLGDAGTYIAVNTSIPTHLTTQRVLVRDAYYSVDNRTVYPTFGAPFEAALQASTPPQSTTLNSQFWTTRPKLIVISSWDAEYSSPFRADPHASSYPHPSFARFPVDYYARRFDAVWGRGNFTFAYTSAMGIPGCLYQYADWVYGRYRELAQLTSGFHLELCEPLAEQLSTQTLDWLGTHRRRFQLRGEPDPMAPIVVTLNGAALPISDWTYDATQNAVILNAAPPVGANVSVTYFPRCE